MQTTLLIGLPNSGKSTIFNALSGQFKKVSNYSGITVNSAIGEFKSNTHRPEQIQLIDLPGIYNLSPSSIDEAITTAYLFKLGHQATDYHLVALVLDLHRLEASLSLALAIKKVVGDKLILILNKDDQKQINDTIKKNLSLRTGLKVITISAKHDSPQKLDAFIRDNTAPRPITPQGKFTLGNEQIDLLPSIAEQSDILIKERINILENVQTYHHQAREIIAHVFPNAQKKSSFTKKIDRILLHPLWGSCFFLGIFYFIFHSIYSWSGPLMDLIDHNITLLSQLVSSNIPSGAINGLITDGIIAGVGGVVIFLPQIMILFFLLSLLEQSGYIARAAVISDKVMSYFGLNGKAFLPYMSGFACSIPAIMAARTIPDKREKMATILTIPLVTCSARLPVYILLIGTFVPATNVVGPLNLQAVSFFFLYFLGSFFALIIAKIFRLTYYKGESSNFIIDLPNYQMPYFKLAWKSAFIKGKVFLKKAGTIILGLSILIWFAGTYPSPPNELLRGKSPAQIKGITLENSYLGKVGKGMEPLLRPIGMDWKMGVGLLVALGARELFVSTLGTIYALSDVDEKSEGLRARLKAEINPTTGRPQYNLAVVWSLLIFFVFALQCTSTLAILKRETQSFKVPLFMSGYMLALAYLGSFLVFQWLS